jgi:K+-sensing histidine kinase KdpD
MPEPAARLGGDGVKPTQAVSNLLNNAIKYTPPGGFVFLRLEHAHYLHEEVFAMTDLDLVRKSERRNMLNKGGEQRFFDGLIR